MEVLYCDFSKIKDEGMNFVMKRGTSYDKLQCDEYCHLYDRYNLTFLFAVAKVHECVVVRFKDIVPVMVFNKDRDHLLKDMMEEHHNFYDTEIVTIIYFTMHRKYEG